MHGETAKFLIEIVDVAVDCDQWRILLKKAVIARVTSQVGDISDQLGDYILLHKGPVRCILLMQYKFVCTVGDRYELTLHVRLECDCLFETACSSLKIITHGR
jgi:hypothetical protein